MNDKLIYIFNDKLPLINCNFIEWNVCTMQVNQLTNPNLIKWWMLTLSNHAHKGKDNG